MTCTCPMCVRARAVQNRGMGYDEEQIRTTEERLARSLNEEQERIRSSEEVRRREEQRDMYDGTWRSQLRGEPIRDDPRLEAERQREMRARAGITDEERLRGQGGTYPFTNTPRTPDSDTFINQTDPNPSMPRRNPPQPQTELDDNDWTTSSSTDTGMSFTADRWRTEPDNTTKVERPRSRTNPRGKKAKIKLDIELELTKEKTGLRINIKSENLGLILKKYFKMYNLDENRTAKGQGLFYSLTFLDNYSSNMLIVKPQINMDLLRYMDKEPEINCIVKNVFTNKEIRQYIKMFGAFMKDLQEYVQKA